ncbi:DUF3427 domain-containing protein [Priestia aryabhattai]|uniref:DUF3427 domain-containing protein n=1 Tax=Priestia aryabhattai TaxID=412384 RepID=UPI0015944ECF
MTRKLIKYQNYSRQEVHDIFDPNSNFLPSRGTWGLHGIVSIPDRENDFVFFVTIGRVEGNHAFDEGVTTDGILTWQSQPRQKINDKKVQAFINHDYNRNNIYLFLRTNKKDPDYAYLGKLAYISHDNQREQPVHFKWQILDWELTEEQARGIGFKLDPSIKVDNTLTPGTVVIEDPPNVTSRRSGNSTSDFRGRHIDFDENNRINKRLGNLGELLVLNREKNFLKSNGKHELAELVDHTSETEGDGAGYDIRSYGLDGKVKYIEVKITKAGKQTPFYLTIREIMFSKQHPDSYYLYRVFDYDETSDTGSMYILNGDLENHLELQPLTFKAVRIK